MEEDIFLEYGLIAGFRKTSKLLYVEKEKQIYIFQTNK